MIVNLVHVNVKPDNVQDFIEAALENAHSSRKEPGNLRFDVLQLNDDPCRFVLYEAWKSEEAVAFHKTTPHYLKWRDAVAEWMAEPRKGVPYSGLD